MAGRLKDIIIHLDYEDEYKDGKVEVNIIASEPEELVRCKDCKYAEEEKTEHPYGVLCNHATVGGYGDVFDFMHYCSYGERKENVD